MDTIIKTRIEQLRQKIDCAEVNYGRMCGGTKILAVSKSQPVERILEAAACGLMHMGESYLSEAEEKIYALQKQPLTWHYIGPIQSNKTRTIVERFSWAHSVDRLKIAQRLNDQRPYNDGAMNICIQVNISGESSKSGIPPDELSMLAEAISELPNLILRGIMAIPGRTDNFDEQRRQFADVRGLFETLIRQGHALDTLSMGMSNDFEAAIAEGATIIRIGTGIFGPRTVTNS